MTDLVKRLRQVGEGAYIGAVSNDRKAAREAADRIEKLEALVEQLRDDNSSLIDSFDKDFLRQESRIEKLEAVTKDDARWLAAYHKWCEMNGCAPSSSDLISARKALEGKDD